MKKKQPQPKGHFDAQVVLKRALTGAHWADDAPILARVVKTLESDLKHLSKDMFGTDSPITVALDTIFKKANADWKAWRKEDDEHHSATIMYSAQVIRDHIKQTYIKKRSKH